MKYNYSQLSSDSVLQLVNLHYKLSAPISCKYYVLGLHDNYLVESNSEKFIFRLYRNDWRTEEEIFFELELLSYLIKKSANVAYPIATNKSELSISINSPEGKRIGVLFHYAKGYAPDGGISLEECTLLGSSVANIHEKTKNFKIHYTRSNLDLTYLVDRSLALIKPFLNSKQYVYLQSIQSKLQSNISQLSTENGDFGICIGDVNPTNFHIDEEKTITHFDFDQCGYGYRAFELGKFSSSLYGSESKKGKMRAFIQGYETVRHLTDIEKISIPYFEIASIIWVMSIHASNANRIGYKYLENSFWVNRISRIEALDVTLA